MSFMSRWLLCVIPLFPLLVNGYVVSAELGNGKKTPQGPVQEEAEWLKSLKLADGLQASVWAKGDQALNVVALDVDEQGRVFAAETKRWRFGGVIDVRSNMFLYKDDLQVQSVAERAAMIEKWKDKFPKNFFTKDSERIRLIVDTDGDGKADKATVFAEGFRDSVDGPTAGVMAYDGQIFMTNIPKLWSFVDRDNDGVADERAVLADGFGPRFSISGHDLHGLAMGPDGRIYFSMGDRGFNVTTKEGVVLKNPLTGGVFRCNPDGTNLEQYYFDLRNPQELAFDQWGNLFTVDNNADLGDAARVVYILEGGSSAWNHGWQLLGIDSFAQAVGLDDRQINPWLDDGLWKTQFRGQPAWFLPSVGHITSGPSGLAYYPGVGFGNRLNNNFLICDYRAGRDNGVWSFALEENGAGFILPNENKRHFLWGLPPTDVTFGYDGRVYIADYIGGWELNDHGRVVTVSDPALRDSVEIKELVTVMKNGFSNKTENELGVLLAHADMRVRQRAQFALVKRGDEGLRVLSAAAQRSTSSIARLHGIWGLGQIARRQAQVLAPVVALLADADDRVREQAAKTLGDEKYIPAGAELIKALADKSARVRSFAAIALGRLGYKPAVPALIKTLADNNDADVFLRHALVMGLIGTGDAQLFSALSRDSHKAVRMGAVLALRHLADVGLAQFFNDSDPLVRIEALRAAYDKYILAIMPQVMAELQKPLDKSIPDTVARLIYLRLIHAAYRYGDDSAAKKLVDFASNVVFPVDVRAVALKCLEHWQQPTWIDPVMGYPRSAQRRTAMPDAEPLKAGLLSIIERKEEKLLASAVKLSQQLGFGLSDDTLVAILDNPVMASDVRSEALSLLTERKFSGLDSRIPQLLRDNNPQMRRVAFSALVKLNPAQAVEAGRLALADDSSRDARFIDIAYRTEGEWSQLPVGMPSADNLATKGVVTWIENFSNPHPEAGADGAKLPRLNDGILPTADDRNSQTVWFDQHEARFVLDLGQDIEVGRVDTFSYLKAPQFGDVWAARGDVRPDPTAINPASGWVKLATINSGHLGDNGKHATTIFNEMGSLGKFRWLMWQSKRGGTRFAEIAVYQAGSEPRGLVRVETDQDVGEWNNLSMGGPDTTGSALSGLVATSVPGFAAPTADAGAQGKVLPRLFSPHLPENDHDTNKNTWSEEGEARWLVDMQKSVEIARINTFSWHHSERAGQAFTVWAADGEQAPDAAAKNLTAAGWRQVAVVNTKGKKIGGKHGSSIRGLGQPLGRYRFLLWQHNETKLTTFISRIDVFPTGVELPPIKRSLSGANIALKQQVMSEFAHFSDEPSATILHEWLDKLVQGSALTQVQLELIAAAEQRNDAQMNEKLAAYRAGLDSKDSLARFRISLRGGNVQKGENIFKYHVSQCIKCHSVNGEGGNAGPDLQGVGRRLSDEKILESLIEPSKEVVPGFGFASVTRTDGTMVAGAILKQDKVEGVTIRKLDMSEEIITPDKIQQITPPISPMPALGYLLNPTELRDVMAYLQSLN
jgi:quinoprotein glucose dehydrogenase